MVKEIYYFECSDGKTFTDEDEAKLYDMQLLADQCDVHFFQKTKDGEGYNEISLPSPMNYDEIDAILIGNYKSEDDIHSFIHDLRDYFGYDIKSSVRIKRNCIVYFRSESEYSDCTWTNMEDDLVLMRKKYEKFNRQYNSLRQYFKEGIKK